jgi:large subunit ribosomal protein L17
MPTPTKGPRLGGGPAHERLVTFAKRGDLASRRRVLGLISNKGVVHELFTDIAQAMENRDGGYTRITKIGNRKGDNAPMAVIELVLEPVSAKQAVVAEATTAAKRDADKKDEAAPVAETEAAETEEAPEAEAAATEEAPAAEEAPAETEKEAK